jgi:hypothetical protein
LHPISFKLQFSLNKLLICFCTKFAEFYFSAFSQVIVKFCYENIKVCECGGRDPRIRNFGLIWGLGISLTLRAASFLPNEEPSVYLLNKKWAKHQSRIEIKKKFLPLPELYPRLFVPCPWSYMILYTERDFCDVSTI